MCAPQPILVEQETSGRFGRFRGRRSHLDLVGAHTSDANLGRSGRKSRFRRTAYGESGKGRLGEQKAPRWRDQITWLGLRALACTSSGRARCRPRLEDCNFTTQRVDLFQRPLATAWSQLRVYEFPHKSLEPRPEFDAKITMAAKEGRTPVHASVQSSGISSQKAAQEIPLRGFYVVHLLGREIATRLMDR